MPPARIFERYGVTPGELLWTGRPAAGIKFRRSDALYIPFSIMWGGFAIFWEAMVVSSNGPWFMKLWGIPFVIVGLYITVGRFIYDAYRRSKTWYAVTRDAALILWEGWGGELQRLYLPTTNKIGLDLNQDGTGSVTFGEQASGNFFSGRAQNWSGGPDVPTFENVPEAQRVYDLCIKAQRAAAAAAQPA